MGSENPFSANSFAENGVGKPYFGQSIPIRGQAQGLAFSFFIPAPGAWRLKTVSPYRIPRHGDYLLNTCLFGNVFYSCFFFEF